MHAIAFANGSLLLSHAMRLTPLDAAFLLVGPFGGVGRRSQRTSAVLEEQYAGIFVALFVLHMAVIAG